MRTIATIEDTHRVAISNHRLVALSDGNVMFRWKDYAHGNQQKLMTVTVEEFLRRFLLHTLLRVHGKSPAGGIAADLPGIDRIELRI